MGPHAHCPTTLAGDVSPNEQPRQNTRVHRGHSDNERGPVEGVFPILVPTFLRLWLAFDSVSTGPLQ